MLQSKESDQFDTGCLIHVVVVVSGFRGKKEEKQNGFVGQMLCAQNPVESRRRLKLKLTISIACKGS